MIRHFREWLTARRRHEQQATMSVRIWEKRRYNAYGSRISWLDVERRRLSGHTTPHPSVGDELRAEMESGRVARFRFVAVEPCGDPRDMWFATVADIGYVDQMLAATEERFSA